jgi:hypothetical protein
MPLPPSMVDYDHPMKTRRTARHASHFRQKGRASGSTLIGRAINGRDGVGSGYDAEIIYRGHGEALAALYRVSSREWVAIGVLTIDNGKDLNAVARDLANNPGSFESDLVWYHRDPEAYADLAEQYDKMESLRVQGKL